VKSISEGSAADFSGKIAINDRIVEVRFCEHCFEMIQLLFLLFKI